MTFCKLSLLAALAAVSVPSLSFAGNETQALNACVHALTASLAPGATPTVKLSYARNAHSPLSDYYAREFTFTLHANDAKGAPLAAVSCEATEQGAVLSMRALQSLGDSVKVAAR